MKTVSNFVDCQDFPSRFHSTFEIFENSNQNFWSNGKSPRLRPRLGKIRVQHVKLITALKVNALFQHPANLNNYQEIAGTNLTTNSPHFNFFYKSFKKYAHFVPLNSMVMVIII